MSQLDSLTGQGYVVQIKSAALEQLKALGATEIVELLNRIEKVEKVKPRIAGDAYEYNFVIDGCKLKILSSRMNNAKMFSQRFLEEFDELPTPQIYKAEIWRLFIKAFGEMGKLIKLDNNDEDDETFEAQVFLNEIRRLQIVTNKTQFRKNKNKLLLSEGKLYLSADRIKEIKDNLRLKISHSRLIKLISKYHIKNDRLRCGEGGKDQVWCWVFSDRLVEDDIIDLADSTIIQPLKSTA